MTRPLADRFRSLSAAKRAAFFARLASDPGALHDLHYDWEGTWAREDQIVSLEDLMRFPLVVFAGPRGCGKTRAAVQLFNREIQTGRAVRPRIFAANAGDLESAVINGDSGIMATLPRWERPVYIASEGPFGVLRYPNGTVATCFSASAPESAVSHQGDLDLYDDVAKWGSNTMTSWSHARYSCRLGTMNGIVATTRRGTGVLRKLLDGKMDSVLVRRPPDVQANRGNLAAKFFAQMAAESGDSDLFRQELEDEELSAGPFSAVDFAALRVPHLPADVVDVAVWVDPSTSSASHSCDVGIVVVALDARGTVYLCDDASDKLTAGQWPGRAWDAFDRWSPLAPTSAHFGVETNKGGNMGPELLRQEERIRRMQRGMPGVSAAEIRTVHTQKSKTARAMPVARMATSGHLRLLPGLRMLEKQLRDLSDAAGEKNDRADAAVHGACDLGLREYGTGGAAVSLTGIGPIALGSIAVGPQMARAAPFQMNMPGR